MRKTTAKLRGMGFLVWHNRHSFYHILLGLIWAWILREHWNAFTPRYVWLAVFGSLLPDIDHFIYFMTYGKSDWYTVQVKNFLKHHEWRNMVVFMEKGHKLNTNLISHNVYVMALLLGSSLLSFFYEWQTGVTLFGAMFIHYFFDIADDLIVLGALNPNWKRWGRSKKHALQSS